MTKISFHVRMVICDLIHLDDVPDEYLIRDEDGIRVNEETIHIFLENQFYSEYIMPDVNSSTIAELDFDDFDVEDE